MKKSNEEIFQENRKLILDNLPSTYSGLVAKLPNVHFNTIRNHLKKLKEENLIHVAGKVKPARGGTLIDCYAAGPQPIEAKTIFFKVPDRIPKPHFLTTVLFGSLKATNV